MEKFDTNEEMIYSLIVDDLEQTISPSDKLILNDWRRSTEANERIYQEFVAVQVHMDKLFDKHAADPQLSWESLDRKLAASKTEGMVLPARRNNMLWYQIAAAVLLVLSAGVYFLSSRYEVVTNMESAAVRHVVLPDGTELSLNAGTVIKYHKENFKTDRRLILEKGEVFIHVVRHDGNQFSVDLGEVVAEDIGTSFNVSRNDKRTSIIVEEGKVALEDRKGKAGQVLLTAGMAGVYNEDTRQLSSMPNTDLNYKAWSDKKFTFRELPVEQVAWQLEKVYKVRVIIRGEQLKMRKLTAKLQYQTLDSALEVISASLQCKVVKEQHTYVLSASQ